MMQKHTLHYQERPHELNHRQPLVKGRNRVKVRQISSAAINERDWETISEEARLMRSMVSRSAVLRITFASNTVTSIAEINTASDKPKGICKR
jgi:hypothetical protein